MKRVTIFVVSLVLALFVGTALSGCSSEPYSPSKKDQTIEDTALEKAGTLRVGVNASDAPHAVESSGQIVGIEVDIAAALADELGLTLELVDVGTNVEKAFTDEGVDIVMGVESEGETYWMSKPYMSSAVALFSADPTATAPTKAGDFKVAVQSPSMSVWEVTEQYDEESMVSKGDLQETFNTLSSGEAGYVAADSVKGSYIAHSSGIQAYMIALLQDPVSYHVAVEADNEQLRTAVETALSNMDTGGVLKVICSKWVGDAADLSAVTVLEEPKKEDDKEKEE